jgi:hypothetical protein
MRMYVLRYLITRIHDMRHLLLEEKMLLWEAMGQPFAATRPAGYDTMAGTEQQC